MLENQGWESVAALPKENLDKTEFSIGLNFWVPESPFQGSGLDFRQ